MRNDTEVQQVVSLYQLGLPKTPVAGRSGELLGRGTGSSLEFQEHREYLPGDDIRHLDWSAYARSDTLMIRLFREEISPSLELILDASRSMNTKTIKWQVARQLLSVFALLAGQVGGRPRISILNNDTPIPKRGLESIDALSTTECDGVIPLDELLASHLLNFGKHSVRVLISDFLFPHDPHALVRKLASESSALWMIQILTDWEAKPTVMGGRRLVDVETGGETDLLINERTCANYRERLARWKAEFTTAARRAHATFTTVIAEHGLMQLSRQDLCQAEILRAT